MNDNGEIDYTTLMDDVAKNVSEKAEIETTTDKEETKVFDSIKDIMKPFEEVKEEETNDEEEDEEDEGMDDAQEYENETSVTVSCKYRVLNGNVETLRKILSKLDPRVPVVINDNGTFDVIVDDNGVFITEVLTPTRPELTGGKKKLFR